MPHYACARWPSCRGLLPPDARLLRKAEARGIKATPEAGRYFDELPDDEKASPEPEPAAEAPPPPTPVGPPRLPTPDLPLVLADDAASSATVPGAAEDAPTQKDATATRGRSGEVWLFLAKYVLAPLIVSLLTSLAAWLMGR